MPRYPGRVLLAATISVIILLHSFTNLTESITVRFYPATPFFFFSENHRPLYTPPPYTTSARTLSPAHAAIKAQWQVWATHINVSQPSVPALKLYENANSVRPSSPHGNGEREPSPSLLRLSKNVIKSLTDSHKKYVNYLAKDGKKEQADRLYKGKGIAIVAGGEYFGPALVGIKMLRRMNCSLPVEVFLGDEAEYEESVCEGVLPGLGAKCVVLPDFFTPTTAIKPEAVTHYQLKSLALLLSSFTHTLLLDSDSLPLLDPTLLLSPSTSEPYKNTGLILWPDYWASSEAPEYWQIAFGKDKHFFPPGIPESSCESGQIIVDKTRHLSTLLLAAYYNIYGPGYYYPLQSQGAIGMGDKETFLSAAVALNAPWHRVRVPVRAVGYHRKDGSYKGCGMAQAHPSDNDDTRTRPRTAFLHVNLPKFNAGHLVQEGDLFDSSDKTTRVRLLGPKKNAVKMLGWDVERVVWEDMVKMGCELTDVVGCKNSRPLEMSPFTGFWVKIDSSLTRLGVAVDAMIQSTRLHS